MVPPHDTNFTEWLLRWRAGDLAAGEVVMTMIYQELKRLAHYYLREERSDHTLQATALVHETYLRLFGDAQIEFNDRAHFFHLAGRQMRHILVDYGRAARADKRAGGQIKLSLEEARGIEWKCSDDLLALDESLDQLEQISPRAVRIVELRFLCGLTEQDTADLLNISLATLKRDWSFAKAFLHERLFSDELSRQGAH